MKKSHLAVVSSITAFASILSTTGHSQSRLDITSVTGYSDNVGVKSARWTGQPSYAPNQGKYVGYYVIESQNSNYFWDINGVNFGNVTGGVWLLDMYTMQPLPNIKITIKSWSDRKIQIVPQGKYKFEDYGPYAYLCVSKSKTVPNSSNYTSDLFKTPLLGIIQSRGFGQCTWEVAYQRLAAGVKIPPSAYPPSVTIGSSYVPAKNDVLFVGNQHTAIITSSPSKSISNGVTTWSFTVTERNADWKETRKATAVKFAVSNGKVVTPIKTVMTKSFDRYWR